MKLVSFSSFSLCMTRLTLVMNLEMEPWAVVLDDKLYNNIEYNRRSVRQKQHNSYNAIYSIR